MSKCPVHMNCYSDVQSELANYKLTSQLYAQLEHSDVGSGTLGSRKDEEEPVNIRPMNLVELEYVPQMQCSRTVLLTLPS